MKKIYLSFSLLFLLTSCAHQVSHHQDPDNHSGCQESEMVDGVCQRPAEGEQNKDLFTELENVDVQGQMTGYGEDHVGYLAHPLDGGSYPGVVMIHEWWGLNDNVKDMARLLADQGYVVLAVDLYNGSVAETPDQARTLASEAREDVEGSVANMQLAVDYLESLNLVSDKIGSMGWCFGGQQSLNLALGSQDIDATVIYYGHLTQDTEKLQNITWPVLGIFGEEDQSIPPTDVRAFESALNELSIKNSIHIYPEVGHAFANPSSQGYAPDQTLDAWQKTVEFLDQNLK